MTDIAVPCKASQLGVDDGLWSILSKFPVVNRSFLRINGQTISFFSNILVTLLASSVDTCKTRSYDTDMPFSKKMSIKSRLRVLL